MTTKVKRILVVEDSEEDIELTLAALESHNVANEVDIARDEVLEGWIASLDEKPTLAAICQRLIEYAINDA